MNHKQYFARGALRSFIIILLICHQNASAQTAGIVNSAGGCSKYQLGDDFLEIADLRGSLTTEIPQLDQRIKEIRNLLPKVAKSEKDLTDLNKQIKELQQKTSKTSQDQENLNSLNIQAVLLRNSLDQNTAEDLQKELQAKQSELQAKQEQLRCVQEKISSLFSPEQKFKSWMSGAFAVLIGLVILGFFVVSYRDELVRRTIFSGQSGMQFLTLFSLVIAIILFGVTGILQDKELAALLGGLSGYILGRYNNPGPGVGVVAPPPILPGGGGAPPPGGGLPPPLPPPLPLPAGEAPGGGHG